MEHNIKKLTDITYTSELTLDILINGNAPKCQGLNSPRRRRGSFKEI